MNNKETSTPDEWTTREIQLLRRIMKLEAENTTLGGYNAYLINSNNWWMGQAKETWKKEDLAFKAKFGTDEPKPKEPGTLIQFSPKVSTPKIDHLAQTK